MNKVFGSTRTMCNTPANIDLELMTTLSFLSNYSTGDQFVSGSKRVIAAPIAVLPAPKSLS